MARYHDVPDELRIPSEALEPTFAYLIGRWFAQAEYMKGKYGKESAAYCDALENFWQGLQALSRLCSTCQEAAHASLAVSNNMQRVSRLVERDLGFSPVLRHRELERQSFRNLATHELEFHFGTPPVVGAPAPRTD